VPARRSIKTYGMYKIIRHPMYFSYIILFIGYLIDNTTLWNSIILGISILFLVLRIINEEKYLTSHIEYQEYMKKVRWKLIPYIY
jgi:protein-S-isoprenylcysteine O-methyltransferase Ste14